jgi:hypothetical protein
LAAAGSGAGCSTPEGVIVSTTVGVRAQHLPGGLLLNARWRHRLDHSGPSAGVLSIVVDGDFQAAGFSLIPSMNLVPRTTSASSGDPFNDRQPLDALSISLNTIVRHAALVPLPLVLS